MPEGKIEVARRMPPRRLDAAERECLVVQQVSLANRHRGIARSVPPATQNRGRTRRLSAPSIRGREACPSGTTALYDVRDNLSLAKLAMRAGLGTDHG